VRLFEKLDDSSVKELAEEMLVQTYKKGEIIIEFGKIDETYLTLLMIQYSFLD